MNLNIYAIKDTTIGSFMNPFYLQNDNVAIREFSNIIKYAPVENNIRRNAKDMQLFKLGEFNEETGEIKPETNFLTSGSNFIETKTEKVEETKGENE